MVPGATKAKLLSGRFSWRDLFKCNQADYEILSNVNFKRLADEESPLYEISARDISSKMQFEIILTMEGITPETGNTIQVNCLY